MVGAIAAAVAVGNTAPPDAPRSARPIVVDRPPAHLQLTRRDRRQILRVATLFIDSAVRRHHPERAWPLASPSLRRGQTLASWRAGSMPVEPYPVRDARSKFAYAVRGEVGLDVWADSTNPKLSAMVFRLTVVPRGPRTARRWLVDGWGSIPTGGFVSPWIADRPQTGFNRVSAKTSAAWVAVPFAVLGLALLVPIAVLAFGGRRPFRRHATR